MTFRTSLIACAILACTATGVFAHGGGLDASGCHTNRKTGEYHCHGAGAPAPASLQGPRDSYVGQASVVDGDTIEIHGNRFRLHGIDAPESRQLCGDETGKAYRCGADAAFALADRIGRQTVSCEYRDQDRYGRIVAVCSAGGEDLNAWMVSEGHAMAYVDYARDYVAEEDDARAHGRGIWRGSFEAPWDWRRAH